MPNLSLFLDAESIPTIPEGEQVMIDPDVAIELHCIPGGMKSGKPSVMFIFKLPDGRRAVAKTSAQLIVSAARAIGVRYEIS